MKERKRALILAVFSGCPESLPILHSIDSKIVWAEHVFEWLVRNQITGQKFVDWFKNEQGASILRVASYVRSVLTRDQMRPILVGKDFRTN